MRRFMDGAGEVTVCENREEKVDQLRRSDP